MMKRHIALIWLITQFPLGIGAQSAIPPGVVNAATAEQVNRSMGQIVTDLFEISTDNLQGKLLRIVFVIAIVLVAKYVMAAIQVFSRFLVYNEWGPLRLIFRQHKRSVTLNALFINVAKYVVYFTAMGYILRELGVNYTTYLASLSLIGIAVGFGSQGLVQDVVTGFFILFENQFSVGDMVEISGQVGIVEDIGLRTTRLRNYFGAELIFQNRNIPMVTRYAKNGLEFHVDVAITDLNSAVKAGESLGQVGEALANQFPEVIIGTPEVKGLVQLDTDEWFVRLYGRLWPAQQWVVDTQLLPRIREIFKRYDIEIKSDRIVAFYHLPGEESATPDVVKSIRDLITRAREKANFFDPNPDQD